MQLDTSEHTTTYAPSIPRQELYRQQYRRVNGHWEDSLHLYRDLIDHSTQKDTCILDIGCGHGDFLGSVYARTPHTYGIDPDEQALKKNSIIRNTVLGAADALPFPANFFDLVVSAWVLEHLDNPERVFQEIPRISVSISCFLHLLALSKTFWTRAFYILPKYTSLASTRSRPPRDIRYFSLMSGFLSSSFGCCLMIISVSPLFPGRK